MSFCELEPETNDHIWLCPNIKDTIQRTFITLENKLIDLLKRYANKLSFGIPIALNILKLFDGRSDPNPSIL